MNTDDLKIEEKTRFEGKLIKMIKFDRVSILDLFYDLHLTIASRIHLSKVLLVQKYYK